MKQTKWEVGSQVTVTFLRRPTLGADPDEFPPAHYLGVITGHTKDGYEVKLEGSPIPFTIRDDQVDCVLSLFAGIR